MSDDKTEVFKAVADEHSRYRAATRNAQNGIDSCNNILQALKGLRTPRVQVARSEVARAIQLLTTVQMLLSNQ